MSRVSVLLLAPYLNGNGLGEVYSIFKWVQALCEEADVTILTVSGSGMEPLAQQLPKARVVALIEPDILYNRFQRLNAMAKPYLPVFFHWAKRWIKQEMASGTKFDIAHQILPQAMRYTCPLKNLGLPYVVGPLGGSLDTPRAFRHEVQGGGIYTRLRNLDRPRLAYDPFLRAGYEQADVILGVAPYIHDILTEEKISVRRFEAVFERGHDGDMIELKRQDSSRQVQLLHVGRGIRTKGLRDVIRALAHLQDLPEVTLVSAGDGEDLDACRAEADRLGLIDRVTFLGRVPREDVDRLYAQSDIFTFPSFREPMGGVFFEAMGFGLPVITAARGGPDFIIDDTCGIRVPVTTPDQFAIDIADAVRQLTTDPERRHALGRGAQTRLATFGDWSEKALALVALYKDVLRTTTP